MSSYIITYLLLYQVLTHVLLVLVLYDQCFKKYSRRYLYQMQTRTVFKFH